MKIVSDIAKMQELSRQARAGGLRIGFVPTMGYLHEGHLQLLRRARALSDVVVVSIFVNPTQFNRRDDFESYPRDEKTDRALLEVEKVDILFEPRVGDVYSCGAATSVKVDGVSEGMEGAFRPGHFDGVATVVAALFNMVRPDLAVFGEKDYQQLQVVRRMTADLHFPIEIVAAPTVREQDGLAMSSRNARLSSRQREQAPVIYRALLAGEALFASGNSDAAAIKDAALRELQSCSGLDVEYVEVADGCSLKPVAEAASGCVLAVAASFGDVRLIDNRILGAPDAAEASEACGAGTASDPEAREAGAYRRAETRGTREGRDEDARYDRKVRDAEAREAAAVISAELRGSRGLRPRQSIESAWSR